MQPSSHPTRSPRVHPTSQPTSQPSEQPTRSPTTQPSHQPLSCPTSQPTLQPNLRPSSYPTHLPTNVPSAVPSSQPSSQPSNPTSGPTSYPSNVINALGQSLEVNQHWQYSNDVGTPQVIMYVFSSALCLVSVASYCVYDANSSAYTRALTGSVGLIASTVMDLIILCGRFAFLSKHSDVYAAYETPHGDLFYATPQYFHTAHDTLDNNYCPVSTVFNAENQDYHFYRRQNDKQTCLGMDNQLLSSSSIFALIIALIWYIVVQCVIVSDEIQRMQFKTRQATESGAVYKGIFPNVFVKHLILLVVNCQQYLLLLPLTGFNPNDYCLAISLPFTTQRAVCLHKFVLWTFVFGLFSAGAYYGMHIYMESLNSMDERLTVLDPLSIIVGLFTLLCIIVYVGVGAITGLIILSSHFSLSQALFIPQALAMFILVLNEMLAYYSAQITVPTAQEVVGTTKLQFVEAVQIAL